MPTQMVNLRLEEELITRLDAVVTRLQADNPKATVTRSSLIKGYIKEGLEKEVFNPMKFKHYTYGNNPESLPLDCEGYIEGYEEICIAAGFNPEDEETNACTLTEDWNGHPAGSIVVTGPTVTGHPFAVAE